MRRSLAPSQVAKRQKNNDDKDYNPIGKKSKMPEHYSPEIYISPFRKPLTILSENKSVSPRTSFYKFPEHSSHEAFIEKILSKPFKLPIPNYKGRLLGGRGLGVRKQLLRKPLHDPFEENALVLYTPPEISAHDAIKMDKTKIPVHVVVDPILSKVIVVQ